MVTPGTTASRPIPRAQVGTKEISTSRHIHIQYDRVDNQSVAELMYETVTMQTAQDPTANLDTLLFVSSRPSWSGLMQCVHHGTHPTISHRSNFYP